MHDTCDLKSLVIPLLVLLCPLLEDRHSCLHLLLMFQTASSLFLLHDDVKFYAALKSNLQDESSAHLPLSFTLAPSSA